MRRLRPIVPAFALLMLAGCYTEEPPAAANTTEETPGDVSTDATVTTEQGAAPAGSTLGCAKRSAQSTVDRLQDRSANIAKEIEDPE